MVLKIFIRVVIVTLIFAIIAVSMLFLFSDKLTEEEYTEISAVYKEMMSRNDDIKSSFYVDTLMKVMNRDYIIDEMVKDGFIYISNETQNAFNMVLAGYDADYVLGYFDRCYIDFTKFVNLDFVTSIQDLNRAYFEAFSEDEEMFEYYQELLNQITEPTVEYINGVNSLYTSYFVWYIIAYVASILLVVFVPMLIQGIKKRIRKTVK